MDGLFRRGAKWYARLAIPPELRATLGKTEFIASTGCHDLAMAKVVASALLAGWRRRIADLSSLRTKSMDLERLVAGHPALSTNGYLALADAAHASGIDTPSLLRAASEGNLSLFVRYPGGVSGHILPKGELAVILGPGESETVVPSIGQMPAFAVATTFYEPLMVRQVSIIAALVLSKGQPSVVLFDIPDRPESCFVPETAVTIASEHIEVRALEVERVRTTLASRVTPAQLALSKSTRPPEVIGNSKEPPKRRVSDAVDAYIQVRRMNCAEDQVRRIRAGLDLFVELEGNLLLAEITSEVMEKFRDDHLPLVPANENQIRLKFGTRSVSESIKAVRDLGLPTISDAEQTKRIGWLSSMFAWLKKKQWIQADPCATLIEESKARASMKRTRTRAQDARDSFTDADLAKIFSSGEWFRTGRGVLTQANTYRSFCPHYYWLPLLGLYTGARINELAQLHLTDIRCTPAGVWFLSLAELDDEGGRKRSKNANSRRQVPLHPKLIDLGFIEWKTQLEADGSDRLFPELKYDPIKGYGKSATKWFSSYLSRLGFPRDNRKVFHSFRATLVTYCISRLRLTAHQTAMISGHAREASVLNKHYVKDDLPDDLIETVRRLDFSLPPIAPFDCVAGLKAVHDALRRKNRGTGAEED